MLMLRETGSLLQMDRQQNKDKKYAHKELTISGGILILGTKLLLE